MPATADEDQIQREAQAYDMTIRKLWAKYNPNDVNLDCFTCVSDYETNPCDTSCDTSSAVPTTCSSECGTKSIVHACTLAGKINQQQFEDAGGIPQDWIDYKNDGNDFMNYQDFEDYIVSTFLEIEAFADTSPDTSNKLSEKEIQQYYMQDKFKDEKIEDIAELMFNAAKDDVYFYRHQFENEDGSSVDITGAGKDKLTTIIAKVYMQNNGENNFTFEEFVNVKFNCVAAHQAAAKAAETAALIQDAKDNDYYARIRDLWVEHRPFITWTQFENAGGIPDDWEKYKNGDDHMNYAEFENYIVSTFIDVENMHDNSKDDEDNRLTQNEIKAYYDQDKFDDEKIKYIAGLMFAYYVEIFENDGINSSDKIAGATRDKLTTIIAKVYMQCNGGQNFNFQNWVEVKFNCVAAHQGAAKAAAASGIDRDLNSEEIVKLEDDGEDSWDL